MAVRHHQHLPLSVRAGHDRAGLSGGPAPDQLVPERQPGLPAADPVLRNAPPDQCGRRRRHRARPGVRVRDELVGLLESGRQHLRRSPGHGGPAGLLPRVDLPRSVDLRLGPALEEGPPGLHLARGRRHHAFGGLHHGGQLMDATPGRLCAERAAPASADRHLGPLHQPGVLLGLHPRPPGIARHRCHGHAGRVGVADPAQAGGRGIQADRGDLDGRAAARHRAGAVCRERARGYRRDLPAHEDRRRRGPVEHLHVPLQVLRLPDRWWEQRPDAHQDLVHPRTVVGTGHQPSERGGPGPQPAASSGREEVRTGQLHPQRVHPVLVDAGHGLSGRPGDRVLAVGRLAPAPPQIWKGPSGSCASPPGWWWHPSS